MTGTPRATPSQPGPARRPDQPGLADLAEIAEIDKILAGTHHDPHSVLGAHQVPGGTVVRALRPLAASVTAVLPDGRRFPLAHVHQGVFAATLPLAQVPDYRLAVTYPASGADGTTMPETVTDGEKVGTGGVEEDPLQAETVTGATRVRAHQHTAVSLARSAVPAIVVRTFMGPPHAPGR